MSDNNNGHFHSGDIPNKEDQIEQKIFDLLLNSLNPEVKEALLRCSIPHWFNEPILSFLLDISDAEKAHEILESLSALSFVKITDSNNYLLHEKVRERFVNQWRIERFKSYKLISNKLWKYYHKLVSEKETSSFLTRTEELYHDLAVNGNDAFDRFKQELESNISKRQLTKIEGLLNIAEDQKWAFSKYNKRWLKYYWAFLKMFSSNYHDSINDLNQLSEKRLPRSLRGRVYYLSGLCNAFIGFNNISRQNYLNAIKIFREINDLEGLFVSLDELANVQMNLENYEIALSSALKALEIAEQTSNQWKISTVFRSIGSIYRYLGNFDKSYEFINNSLKIRRELNDEWGVSDCLNSLSISYYFEGKYDLSIETSHESLNLDRKLKDLHGEALSLFLIGDSYYMVGAFAKATDNLRMSYEISKQCGMLFLQIWILEIIGKIYLKQGEKKQAFSTFKEALNIAEQADDPKLLDTINTNIRIIKSFHG